MKFLKWLGIVIVVLILIYLLGPKPSEPHYITTLPFVPAEPVKLEEYIRNNEQKHKLKPDNEARIIWADDSLKGITEYAVVYLHGFSASQEEGDPVHTDFARNFGCNLYLSRLDDHGIDTTEPLLNFSAEGLWNSAKQAYAIGKKLGKKVIIMATSTGGTVALKLAKEYPEIAGLILMSPNIEINDPNAWILNDHWGLQIARMIKGKYNTSKDTSALYAKYWNTKYRMEATVQLEELLESSMNENTFKNIKTPTLVLCYFKDEEHQDPVVKVVAMKKMFMKLGTPDSLKRMVAIPNAGEHVLGSYIKSKDIESVQFEAEKFAREILHLKPAF